MPHQTRLIALAVMLAASAAFAHSGVQNPAVKARMHAMSVIGQNTKVLGTMSKGQTPFDAATARAAGAMIEAEAARVTALFRDQEDDPKSEALPAIWANYGDFAAAAGDLQNAARLAASVQTQADLRAALQNLGGACQACHLKYRE